MTLDGYDNKVLVGKRGWSYNVYADNMHVGSTLSYQHAFTIAKHWEDDKDILSVSVRAYNKNGKLGEVIRLKG